MESLGVCGAFLDIVPRSLPFPAAALHGSRLQLRPKLFWRRGYCCVRGLGQKGSWIMRCADKLLPAAPLVVTHYSACHDPQGSPPPEALLFADSIATFMCRMG